MALEFIWDSAVQRYRYKDSGKFLSQQAVTSLTQKAIAQVQTDVGAIADLLVQGKISVGTWESETAYALRRAHLWNYMLGVGGQKSMTAQDYKNVQAAVERQFQYLRGFSDDLVTKGMSEAQFRQRIQLYNSAANGTYHLGRQRGHERNGAQWERRRRTKANSCNPCISYAAMGWQAIGTLPNPQQECDCFSNCGCYKEYSWNAERPDAVSLRRFGWIGGLPAVRQDKTPVRLGLHKG